MGLSGRGTSKCDYLGAPACFSRIYPEIADIRQGVARVVIGIQLVMAGYQLPAKYPWHRWKEMFLLLIPVMTVMWLCTTGCVMLMIPKQTTLTAMVIASLVTPTDPVLSQAIAKGPFADRYVPRALREIISAEAGANDGFAFPFLLLATYLIRHAPTDGVDFKPGLEHRSADVGRLGGGTGKAIEVWIVEGWLYFILVGVVVGAVVGIAVMHAVTFTLRRSVPPALPALSCLSPSSKFGPCTDTRTDLYRKWIDTESLLVLPSALGLFILGILGLAGLDDLLACFVAGCAMNWNGAYLNEALTRHDEVNSSIDVLLNFGGFMYIGTILPWSEFNSEVTGITPARLVALGILVLVLRRIPVMMVIYKTMPNTIKDWKESLFMGYFGPIGIGAVFYVEHARHLFPHLKDAETHEEENMLRAMGPVVYFLVLFSIIVHGLSIPALETIYRWRGVQTITELEPSMERRMSMSEALPPNSHIDPMHGSVVRHNRFSRVISREDGLTDEERDCGCDRVSRSRNVSVSRPLSTFSRSRNMSIVSRPVSRGVSHGRAMPETPVWKLGDDKEDSNGRDEDEVIGKEKDEEEKEGLRIQFADEGIVRSPRSGDLGSPITSFALRDGVYRTRSLGRLSGRRNSYKKTD